MKYIVGIDIGGTNIKAAIVNDKFKIMASKSVPTPYLQSEKIIFSFIIRVIKELMENVQIKAADLRGIGLGIPGLTDSQNGMAHCVSFLRWVDTDVTSPLSNHFQIPVFCENDGSVNILGEMYFGAGKGYKNIILLTLGTGLGSGIVVNGELLCGENGAASEVGHMLIEPDGDVCVCGKRGCFESCCSATALTRFARRMVLDHRESVLLKYTDGNIFHITGEMIHKGYLEGDEACIETIRVFNDKLSVGIGNLINLFNPGLIILSGGVSKLGDILITPVRAKVEEALLHPVQKCEIVIGKLYTNAGVLGACGLVAKRLEIHK